MTLDRRLRDGFAAAFGGAPDAVARAPGRVNLIGEHTDYNDGFVLPCALGVETRVAVRRRDDRTIRVTACDFGNEADAFDLDAPTVRSAAGGWRDYVRGTIAALRDLPLDGVDLAIAGDIPRGCGLSSSASLEVAVGLAVTHAARLTVARDRLALAGQRAEHDFAGVRCGIMDQLVSAAAVADAALLIDCRDLSRVAVPFPADAAIAVVQSGVARGLVDGHYNRRRAECAEAARLLGVASLRNATLDDAMLLPGTVGARARHVASENARTLAAARALGDGELARLGALMADSQRSMRDDFAITVPAVDRLVEIARTAIAATGGGGGARMTGGGFGGAVVVITRRDRIGPVIEAIRRDYRAPDGKPVAMLVDRPCAGASIHGYPD